jgi:sensor histidine kinase YesM
MKKDYTRPFQWALDSRYRLLFHVVFWVFIYSDELLSLLKVTPAIDTIHLFPWEVLGDMALVYVNLYLFIPLLLLRNRFWLYIGASFVTVLLNIGLMFALYYESDCNDCSFLSYFINIFLTNASLLASAVCIKIFKIFIKNRQRLQELQTANLNAEITNLKNQINPHFLFNALNNIHVLSRKKPAAASESILLLSDLLRYQLYDCSAEKVPLVNEIDYLKNYLELDKMRKENASVDFQVIGNVNGLEVAPFLFIPFVENAIKHSASLDGRSCIAIRFDLQPNRIEFHIKNDKSAHPTGSAKGGIGLANVRRRLDLLYPAKHALQLKENDTTYSVDLVLEK